MDFMLQVPLSLSEDCGKVLLRFLREVEPCISSNSWSLGRAIKLAALSTLSSYIPRPLASKSINESANGH